MNEPNEVLVMTTCKCRENTKNLVMTRTYFTEMLENKIAQGVKQEQERIVEILEGQLSCTCETPISHAIQLIKGKSNV
jgi:hypothetical protein